jgi:hypothetical protein
MTTKTIHCRCGSTRLLIHSDPGGLIPRYRFSCLDCCNVWLLSRWVVDAIVKAKSCEC